MKILSEKCKFIKKKKEKFSKLSLSEGLLYRNLKDIKVQDIINFQVLFNKFFTTK